MADANAVLQGWIDDLRALGRDALTEIAKEAAPDVEAAARATAAAGTAPDGTPWAARKKDGGRPLEHAAEHITVRAAGPTLRIYLKGPDVFHHYAVRGEKRRQVIPDGGELPPSIAAAIRGAAARVFARRLGGLAT